MSNVMKIEVSWGMRCDVTGYVIPPCIEGASGYAVVQLVEALRHKPEGRGFDSRWCHWNFSLT